MLNCSAFYSLQSMNITISNNHQKIQVAWDDSMSTGKQLPRMTQ